MSERVLEIDSVSKEYRLGSYGSGTLYRDMQSFMARIRGREDPNRKIYAREQIRGEYLMALNQVSLALNRGDALGILGRNGAGKSTLLKLISRITAPTAGEIRIKGRVASLLEIGTGFHPELTGRENIYLNGAILGMTRGEITRKLDEIVDFSEISQFVDTPVKRYSSGMYVKLAFAVAAHLDPDILICDEVLAVGDVAFQQKCLNKMSDVARGGRAVIYVSHNMRTISQLCSRAVFLDRGRLTYDGTVAHAMDLYAGAGLRSVERDLDALPRTRDRGESMRMLKMVVLNNQTMEYDQDSDMEFTLTVRANVSEPNCRIRFIVLSNNAAPLATAQCPAFRVEAGETFTRGFRVNLGRLAPGEFGIKIQLIGSRHDGRASYYDTVVDCGRFVVTDDPARNQGFIWNEPVWGSVRLRDCETWPVEEDVCP
ncbi:MAG: ABC transporter ATP-binding protein [Eubacteriales bacterium]|nr:ABC transporter ATP-binding protein [Eubacteriales bacterium]